MAPHGGFRCIRFAVRRASRRASSCITVLSLIEVVGPMTHLLPEPAMKTRIGIATLLLITAGAMIWHHRRLEIRIKRYDALLSSVMVLLEGRSASTRPSPTTTLDALIFALGYKRQNKSQQPKDSLFNASIVTQ